MDAHMTIHQVAEYLGVSRTKVWKLVGEGVLSASTNPLDKREKLVPAGEVRRLKGFGAADRPRFRSDGIVDSVTAPRSDELENYLRDHWHPAR